MTKQRSDRPTQPPPLRQQAEERWQRTRAGRPPLVPEDHQAVVYELEVHQMELEIQNEELRAAQVRLAQARDSYLDLYDFAPVGYLTLGDHRVIRQANLTAATLLGVERRKLIGMRLERFVAQEARDALHLYLQAALASQASQSCSLNLFRPDKSGFFARLEITAVAPLRDRGARYRVVLIDVSALRHSELALLESEERYRALFGQGADAVVVLTAKTLAIVEFNDEACRRLGYTREEFAELRVSDFEVIESPDEIVRHCQSILANGAAIFETQHRTKSGAVLDIEIRAKIIHHGGELLIQGVWRDITEQKRAQKELHDREEWFRALTENAADLVSVVDANGIVLYENPSGERMLGYAPGELVGRNAFELVHPDDRGAALAAVQDILRESDASRCLDLRLCARDGSYRMAEVTGHNLLNNPAVRGIVLNSRDITDRKRAENALKELNESLEQRVTERTEAIQVLHDVASVANQVQDPAQAVERCLHRLTRYNGWSFSHAFVPAGDDPDVLIAACVCYQADQDRFCRFREATLEMRFSRGEGLAGRVFASGKPTWSTHLRRDLVSPRAILAKELGIRTALAFPVLVGEKVAAVLEFFSDKLLQPDERIIEVMAGVGMQLGRVLERAKFQEHLLAIPEELQRAFAQDLHDDVGQEMTGLGLKAQTLAEMLAPAKTPAARLAADIAGNVNRTRTKLHGLSRRLLPIELEQGLLAVALEQLVAAVNTGSRIACVFESAHPDPVFDSRAAAHLYRIAQEAVSNALRHSGAQNIQVTLEQEHGATSLRIEDDGTGLSRDALQATGMGLQTMRYRAGLIGGKLEVGPGPRGGTLVVCRLPPTPPRTYREVGANV